jgi:hypothetical protein
MPKRKNILPQMFDVRPVNPDGSLNLRKMGKPGKKVSFPDKASPEVEFFKKNNVRGPSKLRLADVVKPKSEARLRPYQKENEIQARQPDYFFESSVAPQQKFNEQASEPESSFHYFQHPSEFGHSDMGLGPDSLPPVESLADKLQELEPLVEKHDGFNAKKASPKKGSRLLRLFKIEKVGGTEKIFRHGGSASPKLSYSFSFATILILFSLLVPALAWVQKSLDVKTAIISSSEKALGQFAKAKESLSNSQFDQAAVDFSESYEILSGANRDISKIGGNFSDILRFVPGISQLASANFVTSAGEHLSLAGKSLAESAKSVSKLGNPLAESKDDQPSLTDLFLNLQSGVRTANEELEKCEDDLNKVNMDDLPSDARENFFELKQKLPIVNASLRNFLDYSQIFLDVLGYNGPRKYLFLFENNQEMRATGGFIGSYGILDIGNGRVKKLFVDNIYNPDGQLKARVIPPAPIQKMSAVWTMHDANWFPDFPTSAEKVAWFYEKTGGPTVDGVIAITPELLENLLKITGPIEMPEYDTTIDAENFIENTQYEVEVGYDKEENQPKKIIADLTPKILDKVMSEKGLVPMMQTLKAFNGALSERHLLLYSRNFNIQKLISDQKWSGEILRAEKDYLSVINTNINGFKTDGVIDETIAHQSDIQPDGSIVDTVSITRKHNGGNENFDWWNKVNGDWMRLYVPSGAKLLEVSGQTREFVPPALDYESLGFKKDPQVEASDGSARVDEESGTRIYDENNKTVFANWVYVSPGESATITYKYALPFRLSFDDLHHPADSFSILFQKQSGSIGSKLTSEIKFPESMKTIWHWPGDVKQDGNSYKMETILDSDKFVGMAVEK